jgi:hypothetical protein
MKNVLFVAVLVLSACGKKEKAAEVKGDCTVAVTNAVTLSKDEFKKSNITDAMVPKIKDASIKHCNDDKWSNEVLKCLTDSKTNADVTNCQNKLTKEQNEALAKSLTAIMTADTPPAGSGSEAAGSNDQGSAGSGSAAAALPTECADYKAAVEKLATCDKLPAATRDTLKKSFDAAEKTWADFGKLPDAAKQAAIDSCKKGAEAVKAAGC